MSDFKELLNEKFGFTKNLPPNKQPTPARMHDDVTDRNGRGSYTSGGHPMEKYRNNLKVLLNALDTETESIVENTVDWERIKRLGKKYSLPNTFVNTVEEIQAEYDKKTPDIEILKEKLEELKKDIPYWFLGRIGTDVPNDPRELEEEDKESLTNLRDIMDKIKDVSGKEFKRANENSPTYEKTEAHKTLDKFRSDRKIDKTEDINKKPENELGK